MLKLSKLMTKVTKKVALQKKQIVVKLKMLKQVLPFTIFFLIIILLFKLVFNSYNCSFVELLTIWSRNTTLLFLDQEYELEYEEYELIPRI